MIKFSTAAPLRDEEGLRRKKWERRQNFAQEEAESFKKGRKDIQIGMTEQEVGRGQTSNTTS
jgi:hypothetical protein